MISLKKMLEVFFMKDAATKKIWYMLFLSAGINILLSAVIISSSIRDNGFYNTISFATVRYALFADEKSNGEILKSFKALPYETLVTRLNDDTFVDYGYTKRDLSLACLVKYHDIDIVKALGGIPKQQRTISFVDNEGENDSIVLFPALSDDYFRQIASFLRTERWPQTAKGIFKAMKNASPAKKQEVMEAFATTDEFRAVMTLFSRSEVRVAPGRLLDLISDGTWNMIEDFYTSYRSSSDLSDNRRRLFLLDYIECNSDDAVTILLATDAEFAVEKLDDRHIALMLDILTNKDGLAWAFVNALAESPRSDDVRDKAYERLRMWNGGSLDQDKREIAVADRGAIPTVAVNTTAAAGKDSVSKVEGVVPQKVLVAAKVPEKVAAKVVEKEVQKPVAEVKKSEVATGGVIVYTVESGDSLWKISRKFNADIAMIKELNGLDNDVIMPGMALIIRARS